MTKPITLYAHGSGPNPSKIVILLEELGLEYEMKFVQFPDMKKEPYISVNPNGRVPAIEDPNTGITLWESGAIIEYLIETYDKEHRLSFASAPEKWHAIQYLHFQTSGQGPYFGQGAWFHHFHHEQIDSAKERYLNEIKRVTGVIDKVVKANGGALVGGKISFADLAFVPWFNMVPFIDKSQSLSLDTDFPDYAKWFKGLMERPAVAKAMEIRQKAMAEGK
ncbi:glutathione S- transferase, nitrogen catabolite repression regulator [Agyrium rufum]|nr:glutathione S- transferase, nitrogen catabolite repression regulator [Agyrium rufum]